MEKLQCPKCKCENIAVHSRRRYFLFAAVCFVFIVLGYLVIRAPLLKPGEWNAGLMLFIIFSETVFCIGIILAIYYIALGVLKKHTTYFCRSCKHDFDHALIVHHSAHGK
ncbi:MAG TPA: hypothetical protein VIM89_06145 [Mucilaginibacter sp.]